LQLKADMLCRIISYNYIHSLQNRWGLKSIEKMVTLSCGKVEGDKSWIGYVMVSRHYTVQYV